MVFSAGASTGGIDKFAEGLETPRQPSQERAHPCPITILSSRRSMCPPQLRARALAINYSRRCSVTRSQQQFCSPRRKYPTSQTQLFRFIDATVSTTYYATFIFKATPGLLPSSGQSSAKSTKCSTSVNALRHAHDRFPTQEPYLSYVGLPG